MTSCFEPLTQRYHITAKIDFQKDRNELLDHLSSFTLLLLLHAVFEDFFCLKKLMNSSSLKWMWIPCNNLTVNCSITTSVLQVVCPTVRWGKKYRKFFKWSFVFISIETLLTCSLAKRKPWQKWKVKVPDNY